MARVSTQLTQYQTNNNRQLPNVSECAPKDTDISSIGNDKADGSACYFIRAYMNGESADSSAESSFVDPSGDAYKLTIKDFKASGGWTAPEAFDNTVYLLYHARCGAGEGEVLEGKGSRDYAIVYKLETGYYCTDNGN